MDEQTLRAARQGFEMQLNETRRKIEEIDRQLRGKGTTPITWVATLRQQKHRISPEGRERIRQAQLRRWKALKKQQAAGA